MNFLNLLPPKKKTFVMCKILDCAAQDFFNKALFLLMSEFGANHLVCWGHSQPSVIKSECYY